jgi:hypothetical protein
MPHADGCNLAVPVPPQKALLFHLVGGNAFFDSGTVHRRHERSLRVAAKLDDIRLGIEQTEVLQVDELMLAAVFVDRIQRFDANRRNCRVGRRR